MRPPSLGRRLAAELALLATACVWGATFPIAKEILRYLPPFAYLAARFAIATLALLPFALRDARRARPDGWRWGAVVGGLLGLGFAFQTLGLRLSGATLAAFLTAVSVVLVPVFGLLLGKRATALEWSGVASATAGLALLTLSGPMRPGLGELLLLGCAVAYAWHIIFMERAAEAMPPLAVGAAQTLGTAVLAALLLPTEGPPREVPAHVWGAVAGMAVVASALAFSVQAWAQGITTPTRVGLILSFEPLAAALFARWWLGEALSPRQWVGAALIIAGIVMAEVKAGGRGAA